MCGQLLGLKAHARPSRGDLAYFLSESGFPSGSEDKKRGGLTELASGGCLCKSQLPSNYNRSVFLKEGLYLAAPNARDLEARAQHGILSWLVQAILDHFGIRPHGERYQGRTDGVMTLHWRDREERSSTAAISSCCPPLEVVHQSTPGFCQASILTLVCGCSRNDVVPFAKLQELLRVATPRNSAISNHSSRHWR